jgi:hypothetical protein
MASNFVLEKTTFHDGGRMDESGKCTITKRFLYTIKNNSEEKRRNAVFELESMVPRKGSCMSDDARYILKSAEWNCLNWKGQSTKFEIKAVYQRASDDEAASEPWNLSPFNVSVDTVEEAVAFRMAYNRNGKKSSNDNKRDVAVVNSAGDPIEANTNVIFPEFSFSYYVRNFDASKVYDFSNTVNAKSQRILGKSFPSGTLLMAGISTEGFVTYEDDGHTVKWRYTQVNLKIRYNPDGWDRKLLDVGNRAIFKSSSLSSSDVPKPELIYQYYKPVYPATSSDSIAFEKVPTLTNANGFYAADREYRAWLSNHSDATGCPTQLPFEFAESIPLKSDGSINEDAIAGEADYPEVKFQEYKIQTWHSLDIPPEVKGNWR